MKISRLSRFVCIAALACTVALSVSGCNGSLPKFTPQTPVQIATKVCGPAKAELGILQADGVFTGGAEKTLTTIQGDFSKACDAILTTSTPVLGANLSNLSSATFPLILGLISASSLSDSDKATARDIVMALQSTITLQLAMQ